MNISTNYISKTVSSRAFTVHVLLANTLILMHNLNFLIAKEIVDSKITQEKQLKILLPGKKTCLTLFSPKYFYFSGEKKISHSQI